MIDENLAADSDVAYIMKKKKETGGKLLSEANLAVIRRRNHSRAGATSSALSKTSELTHFT